MGAWLAGCASTPTLSHQTRKLLELRTALGVGYMRSGQLGLAQTQLAQALSMDPTNAAANSAMAIVEERLGESAKAGHYFRQGLAHHRHDGSLQNNYGAFLCSHGKIQEGIRHFKAALHAPLYPTPQLADLNMGVCLLKIPNKLEAVHYFHQAQALAPQLAGPYYYLAQIHYDNHEFQRAKTNVREYFKLARSAQGYLLGVKIGRALKEAKLVHYCATRLLSAYPHTAQARVVETWQREGRLLGH